MTKKRPKRRAKKREHFPSDAWGTPEHLAWEARNDPHNRRARKPEVISDEYHAHLMAKFRGGK